MHSNLAFDVEVLDSCVILTTKDKAPISVRVMRGHDGEVVISHDSTERLTDMSPTMLTVGRSRKGK